MLRLTSYALIYRRRIFWRCDRIQIAMHVKTFPQERVSHEIRCDSLEKKASNRQVCLLYSFLLNGGAEVDLQ